MHPVDGPVSFGAGGLCSVAGPMTYLADDRRVCLPAGVRCPRCDWPVEHRALMLGLCARCGRHLPERLLG